MSVNINVIDKETGKSDGIYNNVTIENTIIDDSIECFQGKVFTILDAHGDVLQTYHYKYYKWEIVTEKPLKLSENKDKEDIRLLKELILKLRKTNKKLRAENKKLKDSINESSKRNLI
jgi:UDP-2,3-diacylglucosamine pyrophosphatase LpxH